MLFNEAYLYLSGLGGIKYVSQRLRMLLACFHLTEYVKDTVNLRSKTLWC